MKRINYFRLLIFVALFIIECNSLAQNYEVTWDYPIAPGSKEWKSIPDFVDRLSLLNIPDDQLELINTDQLVRICLNYPYWGFIFTRNTFQSGYEFIKKNFNGFRELESRPNAAQYLLKEYKKMNPTEFSSELTDGEKGWYMARFTYIELLLAQYSILNNIDDETKNQLIDESAKKFVEKESSSSYGIIGLSTTAYIIGRIIYSRDSNFFVLNNDERAEIEEFLNSCTIENKDFYDHIVYLTKDYFQDEKAFPIPSVLSSDLYKAYLEQPPMPPYGSKKDTIIRTPKGENVNATVYSDDPEWVEYFEYYADSMITANGWDATRLAPATHTYNCHGYAWYVSEKDENDNNVWIASILEVEKYFTGLKSYDSSQDTSEYYVKVYYPYDNHSAVSTPNPDNFISKWGMLPLYLHKRTDCPYPQHYLQYYKLNPTFTGSTSVLCNNVQRTFSTDITNMTGAEFTWEKGSHLASICGGGTKDYFFTVKGDGNGDTYVNFEISTPTGFFLSIDNDFWAGKPIFNSIAGPFPPYIYKGCTGQQYTFYAIPARDPLSQSSYQWMVEPGYLSWYFMYQYYDWVTIVFNDPCDYYQVIARASNTCGPTNWVSTLDEFGYIQIMNCYYFSMYPNPASEYITIILTVPENDKDFVRPSEFNVRIIDNVGISYYSTTKTEDSFTIPVSHLKDGNYFVLITYGNKIESLPLIIKH